MKYFDLFLNTKNQKRIKFLTKTETKRSLELRRIILLVPNF